MADQNDRPPMVVAMEWVTKITTVALEMVVPGVVGGWLDKKFGTGFIALAGFALGVSVGIWHLCVITAPGNRATGTGTKSEKNGGDSKRPDTS